jgi:hypothetical protein
MYADFAAYASGKAVVCGGHRRELTKLEEFLPLIRRPPRYVFERYDVDYVLLNLAYTPPRLLLMQADLESTAIWGSVAIYCALTRRAYEDRGESSSENSAIR